MIQSGHQIVTTLQALSVQDASAGSYTAIIPPDHCYRHDAHGGFQVSLVQCALEMHSRNSHGDLDQPHVIDLHASFLRRVLAGDIEIKLKDTKIGPTTSTYHFCLLQKSKECLTGFASLANFSKPSGPSFATQYCLSPAPPSVNLEKLERNEDDNWASYTWPWSPDSPLKAAVHASRFVPVVNATDNATVEFWSCLKPDNERYTNELLGSVIDTYPRMVESMRGGSTFDKHALTERALRQKRNEPVSDHPGRLPWTYPTLSMSLEIKKLLPPEGVKWLYVRAYARSIRNGRFDAEVLVFDADMDLVAVSHQVAFIVDVAKMLGEAKAAKERAQGKL